MWVARITQWRASGLSAEEYARGKGFEGSTLQWRASQLRRLVRPTAAAQPSQGSSAPAVTLRRLVRAPVARAHAAPSEAGARIVVQVGRAAFAVAPGFDAELVRAVVRCLAEEASS